MLPQFKEISKLLVCNGMQRTASRCLDRTAWFSLLARQVNVNWFSAWILAFAIFRWSFWSRSSQLQLLFVRRHENDHIPAVQSTFRIHERIECRWLIAQSLDEYWFIWTMHRLTPNLFCFFFFRNSKPILRTFPKNSVQLITSKRKRLFIHRNMWPFIISCSRPILWCAENASLKRIMSEKRKRHESLKRLKCKRTFKTFNRKS